MTTRTGTALLPTLLLLLALLALIVPHSAAQSPGSPACLACIRTATSALHGQICTGPRDKLDRRSAVFRLKVKAACATKAACGRASGKHYVGGLSGTTLEKESGKGAGTAEFGGVTC
ncbi:hypothetical protein DFJ74DRAFT_704846 [Hyaloraphidium curvatum]|nr:hypothetical protein DFJ74DRAFT_704846 [Hyaloraphidium curvatum]